MSDKLSDCWQTPKWLFDELSKEHGPFNLDLCANEHNKKCESYEYDYLNLNVPRVFKPNKVKAFMYPPYSNLMPFVEKAWKDSKHCKIVLLLKVDTSTKWWSVFWNYEEILEVIDCHVCKGLGRNSFDHKIPCYLCDGDATLYNTIEYIGPKPGCEVHFLPKRVQFDPPQQLIDSGEVFYVATEKGKKWVQKCKYCFRSCEKCKGKGHTTLTGPAFPSCVVIFDRRGL